MFVFSYLFLNIRCEWRWCRKCESYHPRMNAELPDTTPVMVMLTHAGFVVHVGVIPAEGVVLEPVESEQVVGEVFRQWGRA